MQELVKLGKLTRPHGIKGAVLLNLDGSARPNLAKVKVFFVLVNGVQTPFFISEIKVLGKNLALQFDSVKHIDEAQRLCGLEVSVERKDLVKEKKERDFTGFKLVDRERGEVGTIREVIEMPGQRMFALEVNKKEVLLPFNEELIEKTDTRTRTVFYKAPEGLLDIYLG